MTLTELRYLVNLADTRHFGQAATRCHVSQPTLSAGLKKLEQHLGLRLFDRTNKSVALTPDGAELLPQARRVLEQAERLEAMARRRQGPLAGTLRLGMIPTLGPYLLPWFYRPLQAAYPRLELIVREGLTAELLEQLRDHRLDAALLSLPIHEPWAEALALFDEPFWFICPEQHAFAKKKTVREAELEQCRLILLAEGHCLRDQALEVCARQHFDPAHNGPDVQATGLETVRQLVAAGMGCSLLPALAVDPARAAAPALQARPFAAGGPSRRVALLWRNTSHRAPELHLLGNLIRAHLPPSVRPLGGPGASAERAG
jgi:LysR family hydrogen peroxide-inducible transcriptional activator